MVTDPILCRPTLSVASGR